MPKVFNKGINCITAILSPAPPINTANSAARPPVSLTIVPNSTGFSFANSVMPLMIPDKDCTNDLTIGNSCSPITTVKSVKLPCIVEIEPSRVFDCSSIMPKKRPPSCVIFWNASSTCLNPILPSDASFLTCPSCTPITLDSSDMIGTPASINWFKSSAYILPAINAFPYITDNSLKSFPVPEATSPTILSVGINCFASIPKAVSAFPAWNTCVGVKGVAIENWFNSPNTCFAFVADPSITLKLVFTVSIFPASIVMDLRPPTIAADPSIPPNACRDEARPSDSFLLFFKLSSKPFSLLFTPS